MEGSAGSEGSEGSEGELAVVMERLDGVLGELAELDPAAVPSEVLHAAVVGMQRASARLSGASSGLVREWDVRRLWAGDGSKSAAARLAREAGLASGSARSVVRRARQLGSMPLAAAALAAGEITVDHVDVLASANATEPTQVAFADAEEMLVGFCRTLRFEDARRAVGYWRARVDAAGDEDRGRRLREGRRLAAAATIDGVVAVDGVLDPVGGAAFLDELARLERAMYEDDQRVGALRTIGQRRADALVEMAHRSRTAPPGGVRPRPLITVLVGEASFARTCELANGHVIAPGLVVPLLGEADVERIVFDGPDRVLSVSSKRTFTGALRRAIEVRDRHCTHPAGCDVRAEHCDVDHTIEHRRGGPTAQHNGRLRCPGHNRDETRRNQRPGGDRGDGEDDPADDPGDDP